MGFHFVDVDTAKTERKKCCWARVFVVGKGEGFGVVGYQYVSSPYIQYTQRYVRTYIHTLLNGSSRFTGCLETDSEHWLFRAVHSEWFFFSDKGIMFLKAHQHATNMNWEQPDNGPESQETTVLSSDCFSVCSIKSCASDSPTFLSHLQRKRVIHEVGNLILRIIALRFQQLSMISFVLIP